MILAPSLGHLGGMVGSRPWVSIFISLLIGILSFTSILLNPPKKNFGFEYGYTTSDAPSIMEMRAQRDFFTGGKEGNPWYQALFVEPRNKEASMHTGKEYNEMKQFYKTVKNATIRYDEELGRNITYYDLCGSTCELNELLFTTVVNFHYFFGSIPGMSFFGLSYPVTSIFSYQSNIGKHFYEVEVNNDGDLLSAKKALLVFMAFYQTREVKSDLTLYEEVVQYAVDEHNANLNNSVIFTLHGERGMAVSFKMDSVICDLLFQIAVQSGMEHAFKYLGAGVVLSTIVLFGVLLFFSRIFSQFTFGRIVLLWITAIIVPILSFLTSFAIYNFFGYSITPLTIFTPFLALIHGYYTVIMLTHTWLSDSELRRDSRDEHLLEVFATCMPSLIVTASPAIAFIICSVHPIANYASVSFLIGLIMAFTIFFAIFFFSPAVLIICPARYFTPLPTNSKQTVKSTLKKVESMRDCYCEHIDKSKYIKVVTVLGVVALLVVPVYIGCTTVEGNLDYRQLLKPESPKNYGVHLMSDVVWPTWFSIMFFVNKPPNFANPREYGRFKSMMAEIEAIDNKLPQSTDMVWINDFCRHTNAHPNDAVLNMTRFKSFIEDPIYKSWGDGVKFKFHNDTEPEITSMLHIVTFEGTKSLADKARLFEKCRAVTNKYPEFKTTPFDTEIGFADIIRQAPYVIVIIPLCAFGAMFVVSAIIIGNLSVAILNFLVVCLLYSSTVGTAGLFGVSINPFNVAFYLIVAALSPSFTTHFCYYYQQAMRINSSAEKRERMNEMLRKCFFPCISSVICSMAVFLPALICHISIFETVAFANTAFCTIGVLLAFSIQVFLNMTPDMLTGTHWLWSPTP
ncbi:CRE-PTR-24.2 protein [Caenorhabditis remanei]|uniref:CRE-PTR-24.2 protein n=1 Tax=Caenorhabditis remanei TaxID=31234 RepID=E3NA92_CAERE|nr:CRE-PTR-24.2 protein [Caenorhabditis remanei]